LVTTSPTKIIKFSFINSLKESHVLRMGSAHEILTQMKKSEEEKLLAGIEKHNYESC
jgi:flagellar motor switch protein FliG